MRVSFIVLVVSVLLQLEESQADINDKVTKFGFLFPKQPHTSRSKRSTSEEKYEDAALDIIDAANYILDAQKNVKISKHNNAIFLLGLPDSGKTSIITLLTGKKPKVEENGRVFIRPVLQYTEIYPMTTIDDKNNVYIECPSLKDNGNISLDLTSGYFIKKTFDNVKNVKILLVFPLSKLETKIDEENIENLLSYTKNLLRNVNHFSKSIGLIITNFEGKNSGRNTPNNKTDIGVKNKVVAYLSKRKQELQESAGRFPVYEEMVQVIDNLIVKSGKNEYENIMIVDSSKDEISKKMLSREIQKNLKFVEIKNSDIKYVAYSAVNNREAYYYQYFSSFMEAGALIKKLITFFKLLE